MNAATGYRPEIDGLRAIAVVSVVIYHLFHGVLRAGYLGVDIFFVISGFLITTILVRECEQGSFSILRFYERRIRRLAPALLFMVFFVSLATLVIYLSSDLVGYSKSVLATFGFVSNIYFWRDTDYFSADAQTKPLLHTWSLGIEEQFYIFFPILVFFVMRWGGRRLMLGVALAVTILSFAIAVLTLEFNKSLVAFYLLPMRAWELGIGAILALLPLPDGKQSGVRTGAAAFGAAMAIGALLVDADSYAPVPAATFACLGAALFIWGATRENPVGRLLALPLVVGIGLISYSLYLWHWPVYVIARYGLIRDPGLGESVGLVLLSVALATVSWRFVERPFRTRAMSLRRVLWVSGIGTALLSGLAIATILLDGLPGRFTDRAAAFNQAAGTHYRCPVQDYLPFGPFYACPVNLPDRTPASADVVLLGNSHAQMYVPALQAELAQRNLHGLLVPANACLPTLAFNLSTQCIDIMRQNVAAVADLPRARVVILAFSWDSTSRPMVDSAGTRMGAVPWPAMQAALSETIATLQNAGKTVILVGPIPHPGYNVASVVSREIAFRGEPRSPLRQSRADYDRVFANAESWLDRPAPGLLVVRPSLRFCNRRECSFLIDGQPAFSDDNHLAASAMPALRPLFGEAIDAATGERPAIRSPAGVAATRAPGS